MKTIWDEKKVRFPQSSIAWAGLNYSIEKMCRQFHLFTCSTTTQAMTVETKKSIELNVMKCPGATTMHSDDGQRSTSGLQSTSVATERLDMQFPSVWIRLKDVNWWPRQPLSSFLVTDSVLSTCPILQSSEQPKYKRTSHSSQSNLAKWEYECLSQFWFHSASI